MAKSKAELQLIPLALIDDHPDNPRLVYREDVVDGIAASLNGEYPQKHALHVRRIEQRYQTLSGHHRRRAATKAGVKKVWAWVEPMEDDAALMELVLSNRQGELSPLEIGMHVLKAVPKAQGGKGKKGGLSEYAAAIGKTKSYAAEACAAAEVAMAYKPFSQENGLSSLLDCYKHLAAIHALPAACWPAMVAALVKHGWSAEETRQRVEAVKQAIGKVADEWQDVFLTPERVAAEIGGGGRQPATVERLSLKASEIRAWLEEKADASHVNDWRDWLKENATAKAWEMAAMQAYFVKLQDTEDELRLPTGVFDVILADPPWQYDFAETDNRQIENQYATMSAEAIGALPVPSAEDTVLFLWATAPKLREALVVMEAWGFEYKTHAIWDKKKIGMGYWFRGRHELLLVGTKGDMSPPEDKNRHASIFEAARGRHSAKPAFVYELIESMFPEGRYLEMFARNERKGWTAWGNQAPTEAAQ